MAITRIQTIYVAAPDVAATAAAYERILGEPRFSDGEKWIQFSVGETGFAVASLDEAAAGAEGAVVVFEADDEADHRQMVEAGMTALGERDMGGHGRTRAYRDPAGHLLQLFWRA